MKIVNKTRQHILAENAVIAQTLLKRITGLLNHSKLNPGEALIIKPCNSIHTFFMRFAIDVIFVDAQGRIIKTIRSMAPFRISGIYFRALFCIELAAGTLESTSTRIGDYIAIQQ